MLARRSLLLGTASLGALACRHAPAVHTRQPAITHGVQTGDIQDGHALVWSRCDEPARMLVEWSTSPGFADPVRVVGPVVGPATDHTGRVWLTDLPPAQTISYRVRFEREAARGASAWHTGRLATPHPERFRLAWSGDTCGQGYGRNPEWGGLRGYAAVRAAEPALFINAGDLIYADNPILPEQPTPDGRIWKNLSDERLARVAESLDDFRARYAYNLGDEHVRALAADVSLVAQWDDHEVHNNWWPGQRLADDRYRQRDLAVLAPRARQAFREWTPIGAPTIHRVLHYGPLLDLVVVDLRSFRAANGRNRSTRASAMLGPDQTAWLVDTLARSRAAWKIVCCDQPLALEIPDGPDRQDHEGWANGDGPPLGRELELADLLSRLKARGVRNTVWITADVHYAAAHHFDPARALGGLDFTPFWEFVAGPLHAGTFGPNPLDPTFGPEVRFQWTNPAGTNRLAPWDGHISLGTIDVTRGALRVALRDLDGRERYTVELPASPA